jgi:hypothetical protein
MRSKILTGAAACTLATAAGLGTSEPASAQNWQGNRGDVASHAADLVPGVIGGALATATLPFWATGYYGYYDGYYPGYVYPPRYTYAPNYAHTPGYIYAPLYGYYGAYDWGPSSYRGGPHPR